jgi:glycosyltransferase involved in cell wall biosynthesis
MEHGVRIGLNLLHAQPEIGGGWHYIANLVAALAEHGGSHEFVTFVTATSAAIVPPHPRFQRVRVRMREASRIQRILYENFRLPGLARRMRVDVLHWFANTYAPLSRVPNVVTVYDLLAFTPAAPWGTVKLAYLRTMIRFTVSSAHRLLPISYATGDQLRTRLGASPELMTVIPPVLSRRFQPQSATRIAEFKRRYALPDHYWLYVAHFYSHKNHKTLIEAYRQLTSLDGPASWPLILRGDGDWSRRDIRRQVHDAGLDGKVFFLPRLDDADLPALYTGASALVFPSTYEGSGMPVIEAMACGCPVVATAQPAVVESGHDAIWAIEQPTAVAFCQAMQTIQSDPGRRADMSRRGLERAVHFRSDVVVPLLLEAYSGAARRQDQDDRH